MSVKRNFKDENDFRNEVVKYLAEILVYVENYKDF